MMARDRRYGKSSVKTRVGIATAVLVGGAVAAAAVVSSHGAAPTATSAAYASRFGNEGTMISSAMNSWSWSRQSSYSQLGKLTQARLFSQTTHQGKMLAVQRGIVVLATKKFLILQSANGSPHLWLLSGNTHFQNVSNTMAGTQALTANTSAAQQAMTVGQHDPGDHAAGRQPDHGRGPADADPGGADRHRPGGQHQPHRDGHGDQDHGDGQPDRDHPADEHADLEPHHVHPERVAAHERTRPR